jgi:beta-glucosidase
MSEIDLDVHLTRRAALDALVDRLDLERKVLLLTGADFWTLHPLPEIGLDALVLSDGPVGVRGTAADERDPSLLLPNPTTLAATWDPDRVRALGGLVGADARRKGVHVLLAPTIGLHRSPLGGRNFESWSEDPLVTGTLAGAFVAGVQSQGVGATAKHLVLNDTETERLSYEAEIADDVLHELYLRPFRDLVTAGVWLAMAAYNRYEGAHLTEHRGLLTDLLKGAWGFDGVVVSDWYATHATEASA